MTEAKVDTHLERAVGNVLRELGIPAHLKGYRYLNTGIRLIVDKPDLIYAVTTKLYPNVAGVHGTTKSRVERAMRHAIETAWLRGDADVHARYFGNTVSYDKGKPTNVEFLAVVSDEVRHLLNVS